MWHAFNYSILWTFPSFIFLISQLHDPKHFNFIQNDHRVNYTTEGVNWNSSITRKGSTHKACKSWMTHGMNQPSSAEKFEWMNTMVSCEAVDEMTIRVYENLLYIGTYIYTQIRRSHSKDQCDGRNWSGMRWDANVSENLHPAVRTVWIRHELGHKSNAFYWWTLLIRSFSAVLYRSLRIPTICCPFQCPIASGVMNNKYAILVNSSFRYMLSVRPSGCTAVANRSDGCRVFAPLKSCSRQSSSSGSIAAIRVYPAESR